jgi:cobalt-zinc-cadmium efflux system outer membrane protein
MLVAGGCATPQPDRSFDRVESAALDRTGAATAWPMTAEAKATIDAQVATLLTEPIDQEHAVAIALLNNRALRARYAQVGLAEADLVEAGLLQNPSLSAALGFPDVPPSMTRLDFGLTLNLLRLLIMPASTEIASIQLDAEILQIADAVVETAETTRQVFLNLQAVEHMTALLREVTLAAEASAEFAQRLHAAGNLSDLALANEQALYEQARLDYARGLADIADRRERLNVQLGLWGEQTQWTIIDRLPELPASEPDLAQLESLAVRQRLDLAAAAKEVEAVAKSAGLQRDWRYILTTDVGFRAERDTDGQWVLGPELSIELPIFSQRQAEIARTDSALLGAESRLEAIAIEVRSDVRRLRDRLYAIRYESEHYRDTIVPLRERITMLTQQQYNFMLVDTFDLLAAKREEIAAYRAYIQSIHDYWSTRAALERAVGGRLPMATDVPATSPATQPETMPMTTDDHHGGH